MPLFQFLLVVVLVLNSLENGSAGITSTYIRTEWPSTDIPLDNQVFEIPKGHNAPQQVFFFPLLIVNYFGLEISAFAFYLICFVGDLGAYHSRGL